MESTTVDELVLMIEREGERGFCALNKTDNLRRAWTHGYVTESRYQFAVIIITDLGRERAEELRGIGHLPPDKDEYTTVAYSVVVNGEPDPYYVEPTPPRMCRWLGHDWEMSSMSLDGNQSNRVRVCKRCRRKDGRIRSQKQMLGYYGQDIGKPWKDEYTREMKK